MTFIQDFIPPLKAYAADLFYPPEAPVKLKYKQIPKIDNNKTAC